MTEPLPVEVADPRRSAVVVVDVQNDFIHPAGRSAGPNGSRNAGYRVMTEQVLAPFLDQARQAGAVIVWIQMENSPESITPANALLKRKMYAGSDPAVEVHAGTGDVDDILQRAVCVRGSWGAELYLEPQPGDLVIPKTRYSSFIGTTLEQDLRARSVETVLVAGVVTNQCVESTCRDAYQLDFHTVLVSDCVAEQDQAARAATLTNIERSFGWVRSSAEVLRTWSVPAQVPH